MLVPNPAPDRTRAWRLVIVGVLLPLAIIGALILSASATVELATSQGVPPQIAPAAVGMLEVASLAGTLMWVLVARRSLRRDAVVVTLAATGVALIAGLHAYGWFGAVGALALVGTVHLASRAWREPWTEPHQPPRPTPRPATVADLVAHHPQEPAAPARTVPDAHAPGDEQLQRARELVEQGAGRPTLKRELGVTDHRARQILAEVKQA